MSQLADLSQLDDETNTGDLGDLSVTCDPSDPKVEKEQTIQSTEEAVKDEKELVIPCSMYVYLFTRSTLPLTL